MKYIIPIILVAVACVTASTDETQSSWYGEKYRGNMCADGKTRFDPDKMTCASWDYPFGTVLEVKYQGKKVRVTVTDRGPAMRYYRKGRRLDLAKAAFAKLTDGNTDIGIITVQIRKVK
jgi:rare lipoprotein A